MARKFKCKDCRQTFQLNKGDEEICPKCKSDNIQPADTEKSIIGMSILFIVMAVIGFFSTDFVLDNLENKTVNDNNSQRMQGEKQSNIAEHQAENITPDNIAENAQSNDIYPEAPIEPIDSVEFTLNSITLTQNGFSFIVQCSRIPIDSQIEEYQLFLNENDAEPKITAGADGKFSSNTYFANDGKYYIKAIFNNNTSTLKPINGIIKPESIAKEVKPSRLKIEELQKMIDQSVDKRGADNPVNRWYMNTTHDPRIDKYVKITLSAENSHDNQPKKPASLYNTIKTARAQKTKIKVLSVSYNSDNIIDSIDIATTLK